MRKATLTLILIVFTSTLAIGQADTTCGSKGSPYMRTTLYFGLNRKSGHVSEGQWRTFLRDTVTPRFPQGFTVLQAAGQWRGADGKIIRERTKVLLLVHDDSVDVKAAVSAIIEAYKRAFDQEKVFRETERVCAGAF